MQYFRGPTAKLPYSGLGLAVHWHQLPGGFACPSWSQDVPLEFLRDFHTVWLQNSCWETVLGVNVLVCQESARAGADCPDLLRTSFPRLNRDPQLLELEHSWKCPYPCCLCFCDLLFAQLTIYWPFFLPQVLPPCFPFCSTAANISSLPQCPSFLHRY